ncbi:MAG: hypothetical protein CM1200mP41_35590 [Gammaproteobacteria bacterium]|nr:MAG: hypothetical protein CM1200mP41_35590 [Gammaproteobacteria bacterium]
MEPRFKSRRLSALYLDQQFLAGSGNYLRSEIIHDAGLDPTLRPIDLSRGQLGRLARSTLTISKRSYTTGGITNKVGIAKKLKSQGKSRAAYRFAIFDREGECCYRCGGSIIRSTLNSRRLYSCPSVPDGPAQNPIRLIQTNLCIFSSAVEPNSFRTWLRNRRIPPSQRS